jgi:excisionase family DNA binding protein
MVMSKGHKRLTDSKMRGEGYLLAAEAARKIGVTSQTIYKWIDAEKIGGFRTGYRRYVRWDSVLDYLGAQACEVMKLSPESVLTETPE